MARIKAGNRAARLADRMAAQAPARPMLFVEGHALSEVSSYLSWRGGHVELRIATGRATDNGYGLDVFVREDERRQVDNNLSFTSMESIVVLYVALGMVIEQAREVGWHDVRVQTLLVGGEVPALPATLEG